MWSFIRSQTIQRKHLTKYKITFVLSSISNESEGKKRQWFILYSISNFKLLILNVFLFLR